MIKQSKIFIPVLVSSILLLSAHVLMAEVSMEKKLVLTVNAGARQPALNPYWQPWVISPAYSIAAGYGLNDEMTIFGEFEYSRVYNDSNVSASTIKIGKENADRYWNNTSIKAKLKYSLIGNSEFVPYFTAGMGISIWSINDVFTEQVLMVPEPGGNLVEYSASEFFISGGAGYEWFFRENMSLSLDAQFNYLTGMGADFAQSVEDRRSRGYGDIKIGFSVYFPLEKGTISISYDEADIEELDEDEQAAIDSDLDGVLNAVDLCPDTPPEARGMVDEYGCPIDSDNDGVPDYRDRCPHQFAEITMDSTGCPPDADNDAIPDSIDACPGTPEGYPVDEDGCAILDSIFQKRVLQVQFSESGRGIDFRSVSTLDSISAAMRDFPDVKAVVKGYYDNSVSDQQALIESQREADKIKSYLVSRRISGERIEAVGMGAVNFIATNTTPEGRAKNHRIEIEFIF